MKKLWVAYLLPLLTFLLFASASYAINNNENIEAHVTVIPAEKLFCFPQTFVIKEAFGNVTCFIQVEGANPSLIDISSVRLGLTENSSAGIPIIPGSVHFIDDFNNNGIPDLFVQFDFSKFKNYFAGFSLPGNFHYRNTGSISVNPFSFDTNSSVFAKFNVPQPQPATKLIDYYSAFNGNGGNIVVANGFRLNKYTAQINRLDGFVAQRVNYPNENVQSWGTLLFSSQGYLTVDILTFPYLPPLFSIKVNENFNVVDDGMHSCSSLTNQTTICQSSGWMIKQGSGVWADIGQIPIKTLIYIITPTYAKLFGFDASNNKILEIENITTSTLTTYQMIPS